MAYPRANESTEGPDWGPCVEFDSYDRMKLAESAMSHKTPANRLLELVYDRKLSFGEATYWFRHYRGQDADLRSAAEKEDDE